MTNWAGAGEALLVAGPGTVDLSAVLGRVGEVLLATTPPWRVRRLSPMADAVDRASLKRHVDELVDRDVTTLLIALGGLVAMIDDEPALVIAKDYGDYPEDTTLPLRWICERLRSCRADRVVVVACLDGQSRADSRAGRGGNPRRSLARGRLEALRAIVGRQPGARRAALDDPGDAHRGGCPRAHGAGVAGRGARGGCDPCRRRPRRRLLAFDRSATPATGIREPRSHTAVVRDLDPDVRGNARRSGRDLRRSDRSRARPDRGVRVLSDDNERSGPASSPAGLGGDSSRIQVLLFGG
jgi:hypothetical protein